MKWFGHILFSCQSRITIGSLKGNMSAPELLASSKIVNTGQIGNNSAEIIKLEMIWILDYHSDGMPH
jgi:hypothetical protein